MPVLDVVIDLLNQQKIDEGVPEGRNFVDYKNFQRLNYMKMLTSEDSNDDSYGGSNISYKSMDDWPFSGDEDHA